MKIAVILSFLKKAMAIMLPIFAMYFGDVKAQEADFDTLADNVCEAAKSLEDTTIRYSSGYVVIPYPGGDVNPRVGACTDVVIRAFFRVSIYYFF